MEEDILAFSMEQEMGGAGQNRQRNQWAATIL